MQSGSLPDLVQAAKSGDPAAWSELVARFQDFAVASALGWSGDVDAARDIAQEAFVLAFRHLGALEDAHAFPGWFAQLVRTARARHRRRELAIASFDSTGAPGLYQDPAEAVEVRYEADRVRTAVEALPDGERMVVALHYLADLSYPEVAALLHISVSAAKKRAHSARQRLKELMPVTATTLADARPSRDDRFRNTVLLFEAIRHHEEASVRRLLDRCPSLVDAEEDWSEAEALEVRMPFAARATPLVRAVGAADLEIVRLLLAAGADPNRDCGCAGGESPLWTATLIGSSGLVALLLEAGADPNKPAFNGATPLHVAKQRGRDDLALLLVRAGADEDLADSQGRRPRDWARATPHTAGSDTDSTPCLVPTGIRALDLFAPFTRGAVQWWPAGIGSGQLVTLFEVARALAFAETWWIGFEQPMVDRDRIHHSELELGVPGVVRVVRQTRDTIAARAEFEASVRELAGPAARPRLAICLQEDGHAHDVALAMPTLAASSNLVAALVVQPFSGAPPVLRGVLPDPYQGQVAFDPQRAVRSLLPAIDPGRTTVREYPSLHHAQLADVAKRLLVSYQSQDPDLALPDPATLACPSRGRAAQELLRFLSQPYHTAEAFSSQPGESTPYTDLLRSVAHIVRDV